MRALKPGVFGQRAEQQAPRRLARPVKASNTNDGDLPFDLAFQIEQLRDLQQFLSEFKA